MMKMTFREWMESVDRETQAIGGVSVDALADQPFRDWYDYEMGEVEAAETALKNEGFPF